MIFIFIKENVTIQSVPVDTVALHIWLYLSTRIEMYLDVIFSVLWGFFNVFQDVLVRNPLPVLSQVAGEDAAEIAATLAASQRRFQGPHTRARKCTRSGCAQGVGLTSQSPPTHVPQQSAQRPIHYSNENVQHD